jgi:endonuclease/exonuclease/phosphatase family metal-dependent hydrolase
MSVALRVVSWNVRSLRDDAAAVAATLRQLRPDVVCLQEAPRFFRWRSKVAALARESELLVAGGGRACGANVVFTNLRVQVRDVLETRLPTHVTRHQRGLVLAVLEIGGEQVLVGGTHLSLDGAERVRQAEEAARRLAAMGIGHAVLCGDLNDVPDGPTWQALTRDLRDAHVEQPAGGAPTFPAAAPDRRIDAVLVSPSVSVVGAGVPDGLANPAAASDHLPVVADLQLN